MNKSVVRESEGLDITISFDWTGKGLVKGDAFVTDMTNGFTSITKQVEVPFGANGKQLGVMVLDYDQQKIFTTFTADMDPNKIYNGTINIGTFVDRDYFKNEVNEVSHEIKTADGKTVTVPLEVVFDALRENPKLGNVSVYGKKTIDNSDGSSDIAWATVINKVKDEMTDATVYISPDKITGVEPEFRVPRDNQTEWNTLGIKYDENQAYVINPDTIEVYEADVFDSMGYSKGKQLVKGTDYTVDQSELNPHAYVINFIGDYANTNKQFVIEYGGKVPNTQNIGSTTTDSLVAYYEGERAKSSYYDYEGPFNLVWNAADINFNNSSITGVTSEDITGSVTVVHIDASTGKTLKAEDYVVDSQGQPLHDVEQGTPYTTKSENFEGYRFTTMGYNSDPATGEVKQGLQRVIYLYVPTEVKKGNVDVVYVAEDGTVLEPKSDVAKDAELGTDYTTEQKEFKGYTFSHMGQYSASPTGTVEEGTKHVVYVYAKTGNVDVKYVDTEGKELPGGELTPVKTDEEVGTEYGTTQKTFDGYHFVRMDNASAPAAGVVTAKDQHVIYVYEKDTTPVQPKGNVDVVYVAEDGKVLEPQSDVAKDAELGTVYSTEQKEFKGYTFSHMGQYSASPTGTVEEGTKHVIYVYSKNPELKKGSVDVKYIAKDGKVLEDVTKVKDNAPVGEVYTTEEKSFDGYHFVGMDKTSDSANGKVTEGDKHVVYVYEKDVTPEVKKGSVDVKYVTTDGKVLEDVTKVKDNAPVGEAYTTEEKSFDGYHFVGMDKTSDSANGKVTEGDKHVVYVYEKDVTPEVKKGSVDVKYVTTDGKVLEDVTKVKDNAPVGEAYTTEEKSFDGYHFVGMDKTSDSANGKVTEGDKHIVYVYEKDPEVPTTPVEKKGSVYVKYVDENGNELPGGEKTTVVKDGKVGSYYFTTEKDFDGYTFSHMAEGSSDPTGKVVEGDQQVVYVYTKNNTPQPEPNKPEVPTTPETPAVPQEEKTTTNTPVKTSTSKVSVEKVTVNKAAVLPQTGDKKENNSSVMGLVSLGLAGLLGLGIKRKEEKDNH